MLQNAAHRSLKTIVIALIVLVTQNSAQASEGSALAIHGYGHQGYLQSNSNTYILADRHGSWDYNLLALVLAATVDDDTTIWVQLHSDANVSRLDWAFVERKFTTNITARAGQIKMPFGLYNETIAAHFLQQSTLPPFLYQDAPEMKDENFRGVSVNIKHDIGIGRLSWDIYGGQSLDPKKVGIIKFGRMLGGRATYLTPIEGLRFMASIFSTDENEVNQPGSGFPRKKTTALSVDYTINNWDVKSESAQAADAGTYGSTFYIQAGYTLGTKWTPFMRYDYITTDKTQRSDSSYYQKGTTVGLNYKVNPNVSLRVEENINRGYAMPVKDGEVIAGQGTKDWNMLAASVNFIF